ncbi:MAG: glycoside hydrolase family 10 protein [Saccharofermentanales bacterium]
MKKMLVYNDDGWSSLMRYPAPATVEEIIEHTVGLVAGTGVDIYQLCLLTGNVSIYDSDVLDRYGKKLSEPYRMYMWRTLENLRSLDSLNTDLLRIIIDKCHEIGMEAHASLRINDRHHTYKMEGDSLELSRRLGRSEYVFPDLRSDRIESRPEICLPDGSLDFSFHEARQIRLDTIKEILDKYDVDGIDLDFTRFPPFFREGHKKENAALMTDIVREVKQMVSCSAVEKGKDIKLTARVEYDPEVNAAEGLEIESWIRSGYLDILYLGVIADCTPDAPVSYYIRTCKNSGCKVCPSIEGQFYWVGGMNRMGPVRVPSVEMVRAFAMNAYAEGADGIQLFNFCCTDGPWDRRILTEVPYPEKIRYEDKLYYFTMHPDRIFSLTQRWDSRLMLRPGESETDYHFDVSEDFSGAEKVKLHPEVRLMMRIMGLNQRDDVSIFLNGTELFSEKGTENLWDWDGWSDILYLPCLSVNFRKEDNMLQMIRKRNYQNYAGNIEVIEMELTVNYPKGNVIGSI